MDDERSDRFGPIYQPSGEDRSPQKEGFFTRDRGGPDLGWVGSAFRIVLWFLLVLFVVAAVLLGLVTSQ